MKFNFGGRFAWALYSVIFITCSAVIGISYIAMKKLTFAGDQIIYGESQSVLAKDIREELLKRGDIEFVQFKSSDNLTLSALLCKRKAPVANLVVCHGYKGAKEFLYRYFDLFINYNILIFDFRACGQSDGFFTGIGSDEAPDVIAATRYMKKRLEYSANLRLPTIVLGMSMGAAAAIKAVETVPSLCDALIVDSSYTSLAKIVKRVFPAKSGLPATPFVQLTKFMFKVCSGCDIDKFRPVDYINKIKQPTFFIHACNDSFIPAENSLELYANSTSRYAKIWIGPQCRHAWLFNDYGDLYKKKIEKFLTKAIPSLQV